jgi:hypothetical protein
MRILVVLSLALGTFAVACGGPTKKPEGAVVESGSDAPENCCCKSNPSTSEDGRPVFENANRMECSGKQGECVDEVQCAGAPPVEATPPPPPQTDESAPAVEP